MPENITRGAAVQAAFDEALKNLVAADPDRGWTQKDSMEIIETVVAADVEDALAAKEDMAKYVLSETAGFLVNKVVNPSAFRQVLEKAPRSVPVKGCSTVLRPQPKDAPKKAEFRVAGL
jgi:hypothetical protein